MSQPKPQPPIEQATRTRDTADMFLNAIDNVLPLIEANAAETERIGRPCTPRPCSACWNAIDATSMGTLLQHT